MSQKLLLYTLFIVILSGCGSVSETDFVINERFSGQSETSGTRIITDNETGCKYIFHKSSYSGGLSPLYDENGELYCGK